MTMKTQPFKKKKGKKYILAFLIATCFLFVNNIKTTLKVLWPNRFTDDIFRVVYSTDIKNDRQAELRSKAIAIGSTQSPPKTLGAFIHVGKTGGSTLSTLLRNGCHSRVKKPCLNETTLPISQESIISKLTTYFHIPDFEKELLRENHNKMKYEFYAITLRDPLSRTISCFKAHHPLRIALEVFESLAVSNKYLYDFYLQTYSHRIDILRRIIRIKELENAKIYSCFGSLEEYAQLLANFSDYEENTWDAYFQKGDCANVAKTTLLNAADSPLVHNYWNYREIIFQVHEGFSDKIVLALRQEYIWKDWVSANQWLGDSVENPNPKTIRNSTEMGLEINTTLSDDGRKKMCLALEDEYRIYLRVLVLSINLSEEDIAESLSLARKNCPWLNLQLPKVDVHQVFEASMGRGSWNL